MKKYLVSGVLVMMLVLPMTVKATTIDELKVQIAQLLKQVAQLQQQLTEMNEGVQIESPKIVKFTQSLYKGIENNEARELQRFLAKDPAVYPEGLITGYFGRLTEAAVKRFQKKHGIEQVGVVGPKTRAKLNELCGVIPVVPAVPVITTAPVVPATTTSEVLPVEENIIFSADITNFTATAGVNLVMLSWENPTDDEGFVGVKIIRKTVDYPANVNDGIQVYSGFGGSYADSDPTTRHYNEFDLINGVTYYYKAFAYDRAWNYSLGAEVTATPFAVCLNRSEKILYGECSITKPKYCDDGELVDNCNLCGCPVSVRRKNSEGESCNERCLENGKCTRFSENVDCENKNYKMAFILLAQNADEITAEFLEQTPENRLERLTTIKDGFSQHFAKATRYLASMDTSNDIFIIVGGDVPMRYHEGRHLPDYEKVTKKFYETHDDIYDFISVYTTWTIPEWMSHAPITRNINGIGWLVPLYNGSDAYGSRGKLKGINKMGLIARVDIDTDGTEIGGVNGLLHETGHQWCCFVGDNFAQEQDGAELEIIQQGMHFYGGLQSPCENQTPMGSRNWVSNNDGTFGTFSKGRIRECYHPFQLYFMGLLPKEEYSTKHPVYDLRLGRSEAVLYKQVSVDDIIAIEGERQCVLE